MRWIAGRRIWIAWLVAFYCSPGCSTVSITNVGRHEKPGARAPMGPTVGWPAPQPGPLPIRSSTTLSPLPEPFESDPEVLLTHAEQNRRAGVNASTTSGEVAARFELAAVAEASNALELAHSELTDKLDDSRSPAARKVYNAALRDFLRDSSGRKVKLDKDWEAKLANQGIRVQFDPEVSIWNPERFDEFLFADDFEIKGLAHEYKYEGLGVPLLGIKWYQFGDLTARKGPEAFLMPTEIYAVTAVLKPRGKGNKGDGVVLASLKHGSASVPAVVPPVPGGDYVLELHDPIVERKVEFQGRSEPLATDLTTSLTYHFVHSPLPLLQEVGLLDPQSLEKLAGLYMIHPYIPGKIPVIFVHGLRSSPAAWLKVMNEIRGDPDLRDRYQVWLFMYPTGTPFPYSAAKLRTQINQLRSVIDPEHVDKALDRSVIVGHSMGGLITRLMISSSGQNLWNLVGARPFEELKASKERKEMLQSVFFFDPHPMITRAVFIATPHRGSELGDEFIGRLADRLIRLPSSLRSTYRALILQNGRDFFTQEVRSGGMPSSIDELRENNRLLMTIDKLPIRPGLEAHSVMGRNDPKDSIEESTDGVVAYKSSHIDWANSELVVPSDHGAQDKPETIEELKRILRIHLGIYSQNLDDPEVVQASVESKLPARPVAARPLARRVDPAPPTSESSPKPGWQPIHR